MTRQWYAGVLAALVLQGFGANFIRAQESVLIEGAWVRAMPPSQSSTAGYMSVHNPGDSSRTIVAASSASGAGVEIHTSREVDGLVRMEHLESVDIAPGKLVKFAPGGMHLMILGLDPMPAPGERIGLCLEFESGEPACTEAEVRRVAPNDDDPMHQHH